GACLIVIQVEAHDRGAVARGCEDSEAERCEPIPQVPRQRDAMRFDPIDADTLQIIEGGAELVDLGKRQRRILEFPGRPVDLVMMVIELVLDVKLAKPVESDTLDEVAANEERRDAKPAQKPFVRAAGQAVHARGTD